MSLDARPAFGFNVLIILKCFFIIIIFAFYYIIWYFCSLYAIFSSPEAADTCMENSVLIYQVQYANIPMQYTMNFSTAKNENFKLKNLDIFLMFAQNIDCGYSLEPPH